MIDETMSRLERRIREAPDAAEETKADLLRLLGDLRAELMQLGEKDRARAADVVGRADAGEPEEEEGDVERTVREFEARHPRFVGTLQAFFRTLSDAGV